MNCTSCGSRVSYSDIYCPSCKKPVSNAGDVVGGLLALGGLVPKFWRKLNSSVDFLRDIISARSVFARLLESIMTHSLPIPMVQLAVLNSPF
jgi:hypothetical protein